MQMMMNDTDDNDKTTVPEAPKSAPHTKDESAVPVEKGGPKGPEPTRYGDWESGGRCTDF